ncbi:MAG: hypothetical protein ACXWK6_10710 [Myxococcaceae bacterium]
MRFGSFVVAAGRAVLLGSVLLAGAALGQYYPTPPPTPPPPPPGYYPPPAPPPGYYPPPAYQQPNYSPPPTPARGEIEIGGFFGWQASTNASTFYGSIIIDGSIDFGGFIDYTIRPGSAIELLYIYVPTNARFVPYLAGGPYPSSNSVSVGENWIQLGGTFGRKMGRIEPFGALTLGIVIISPGTMTFPSSSLTLTSSTQVKPAFTGGLGLKLWLTDMLGLRFMARALVPLYFSGGAVWVGTGGASVAVGAGIPWAQFDFTGGVEVKF